MSKLLFICEGNVGRSQMAEAYFNHTRGPHVAVSAGIEDVGAKYDYHPRKDVIEIMREENIDISEKTVKPLNLNMLKDIDLVVILCDKDKFPEYLISSNLNMRFFNIDDPVDAS